MLCRELHHSLTNTVAGLKHQHAELGRSSRRKVRLKTKRRDARNLAEFFRAGLLNEVTSPRPEGGLHQSTTLERTISDPDAQRSRVAFEPATTALSVIYLGS